MPPHDIISGACGALILWLGWYGFNPGRTLSAMDTQGSARVLFNTTLAAATFECAAQAAQRRNPQKTMKTPTKPISV